MCCWLPTGSGIWPWREGGRHSCSLSMFGNFHSKHQGDWSLLWHVSGGESIRLWVSGGPCLPKVGLVSWKPRYWQVTSSHRPECPPSSSTWCHIRKHMTQEFQGVPPWYIPCIEGFLCASRHARGSTDMAILHVRGRYYYLWFTEERAGLVRRSRLPSWWQRREMAGLDLPVTRPAAVDSKCTHSKRGREKVLKTQHVKQTFRSENILKCSIMVTCLDVDLHCLLPNIGSAYL